MAKTKPNTIAAPSAAAKSSIVQKFEGFTTGAAKAIPYPRLQLWLHAYFHPIEAFEQGKKQASFPSIASNYVPIAIFSALIAGISIFLTLTLMSALKQNQFAAALSSFNPVFYCLFTLLAGTFIAALFYLSLHALCRALGGQNRLFELTHVLVLISAGTVALNALPTVLSGIICFGILSLPISIYGIYSCFLAIRHSSGLGTAKTIIAILLSLIITYAVYLLVVFGLNLPWPYGFANTPNFSA